MNEEECAALALLSRMRFACGDNGKRMQDELEEYLRDLRKDAERYRWLRDKGIEHDWTVCRYPIEGSGVYQQTRQSLDAAIDAAMAGANT